MIMKSDTQHVFSSFKSRWVFILFFKHLIIHDIVGYIKKEVLYVASMG